MHKQWLNPNQAWGGGRKNNEDIHNKLFSFLCVIKKMCLPNSLYLDSRSTANDDSSLCMTMMVCEPNSGSYKNECLKYYFKSSRF